MCLLSSTQTGLLHLVGNVDTFDWLWWKNDHPKQNPTSGVVVRKRNTGSLHLETTRSARNCGLKSHVIFKGGGYIGIEIGLQETCHLWIILKYMEY